MGKPQFLLIELYGIEIVRTGVYNFDNVLLIELYGIEICIVFGRRFEGPSLLIELYGIEICS